MTLLNCFVFRQSLMPAVQRPFFKQFLVELENEMDRLDKQESSAMGNTEDVPF